MTDQAILSAHQEAANALLTITTDLTALLQEESVALTAGIAATVEALAARKAELFQAYGKAMETVKALASDGLSIDDQARQALRDSATGFKLAIERNQSLLEKQLNASQSLMQTIGNEVQRQQSPVQTYAAPHAVVSNKTPTSLACNQTI